MKRARASWTTRSRLVQLTASIVLASQMFLSSPAHAWWETQIMALRDAPQIAEVEAEKIAQGAAVVPDNPFSPPEAGGGKAVLLEPGKGVLRWRVRLKHSTYVLQPIGRVPEANPATSDLPEWSITVRVKVTRGNETIGDWTMPINYLDTYNEVARIYFPAHADADYSIELSVTAESETSLLVDRLDLRDALGNTLRTGFKKGRYLWTDEEVARLRTLNGGPPPGQEPKLDPASRPKRLEEFVRRYGSSYAHWNKPFNVSGPDTPWHNAFGGGTGETWLDRGNTEHALKAAELLIYASDWYPAVDYTVVRRPDEPAVPRSIRYGFTEQRFGKVLSSLNEPTDATDLIKGYDAVFPFIQENADELAAMAQTRVPWIKNGEDLIAFLDTNILQHIADCIDRRIICPNGGRSEKLMLMTALAQGPNPAGDRMMRRLFANTYINGANDGGLQDQLISSYLRDGCDYLGGCATAARSAEMMVQAAILTQRYVAAGGDKAFLLSDPRRSPFLAEACLLPLELRLAGGHSANLGGWINQSAPRLPPLQWFTPESLRLGFELTGDPRTAWLLTDRFDRTTEPDAVWEKAQKSAAGQGNPVVSSKSRNLGGFGLAILEAGAESDDFTLKRAIALRHGIGRFEAHADSLTIEYFAHGARLIPDGGIPPDLGNMNVHLGVCVDGNMMHNTSDVRTGGTAWTEAFQPADGAQYVAGAARFACLPQVTKYQRQVALIDVPGEEEDESYVFDVLRVAGGKSHMWNTHGPAMDAGDEGRYELALEEAFSPEALAVLHEHLGPKEGSAGDALVATWPLGRWHEERMLGSLFDKELPRIFVRSSLFGHSGDKVYVGTGDPLPGAGGAPWRFIIGHVHVERTTKDRLQSVWPQLVESYRDKPFVKQAAQLRVTPPDGSASAPVALAIETLNGQKDIILADGAANREVTAVGAGGPAITMVGRFGYVSYDAKGLRLAHLVGGTKLDDGRLRIAAQQAEYSAKIVAVDYANSEITLDTDLPAVLLDGQEFVTGQPTHPQPWKAVTIGGRRLKHEKSAILYQSPIQAVDEKSASVTCTINPPFLIADPLYYDGATATDETGSHTWRVRKVAPVYLWMYLHEPFQDWREVLSDADFPDADGDGRRTVSVTNWGGADGITQRNEIELEVAYVDDTRQIIYFKLPDDQEIVNAGGWCWAGSRVFYTAANNKWLVNEQGRRWLSNYAGKTNAIFLEGAVRNDMFTDADGDGRRVLRMYHFGPGDNVSVQTHVYVARKPDGSFAVDASTPVTVTLPDGTTLPAYSAEALASAE